MTPRAGPLAALGLAAALAGCETLPEGLETSDRDAYEEAAASIGCRLVGEPDYMAVAFQAGLSREQVLELTGAALRSGRAERLEDGGVRLTAGPCEA